MTVKEIMERVGISQTGRAIAYIKDALEEISFISPTHIKTTRLDIENNKRFYKIPNELWIDAGDCKKSTYFSRKMVG